jgi:hypothetical protein
MFALFFGIGPFETAIVAVLAVLVLYVLVRLIGRRG